MFIHLEIFSQPYTKCRFDKLLYAEYYSVHELLHLIIPNHGRAFKTLFYAYLPEKEKFLKF